MKDWVQRLQQSLPEISVPSPSTVQGAISSVLIALCANETTHQQEILLTKRTMLVDTHKGQVSFPGGFWESHDTSLVATALRESQEEIGTDPAHVSVLGALEAVQTHQGVWIYPWVGHLQQTPYPFRVNAAEVERILYLPLETLMKEGLKPVSVRVGEVDVKSYGIYVDGELVWGATARILGMLRDRLLAEA